MGKNNNKQTKNDRLEERRARLKRAATEKGEIVVVKRMSAGLILGVDDNGELDGVRCYHTKKNGEYIGCDCRKEGSRFFLSDADAELQAQKKLVIDHLVLRKQQRAIVSGELRNKWSVLGSLVFSEYPPS